MKARLKKLWKGVKETMDKAKAVKTILTSENKRIAGKVVSCCMIGVGVAGVMLYFTSNSF